LNLRVRQVTSLEELEAILGSPKLYELRSSAGKMLAWLASRPLHCDRGRYYAGVECVRFQSEADPWPRYYFDLDRGKAEIEAYLAAKGAKGALLQDVEIIGAHWLEVPSP